MMMLAPAESSTFVVTVTVIVFGCDTTGVLSPTRDCQTFQVSRDDRIMSSLPRCGMIVVSCVQSDIRHELEPPIMDGHHKSPLGLSLARQPE